VNPAFAARLVLTSARDIGAAIDEQAGHLAAIIKVLGAEPAL
jgi:hypothetical protein